MIEDDANIIRNSIVLIRFRIILTIYNLLT
nr:MAG TPA: hypothetical protein [Caudoviricetes sp.]